MKTSVKIIMLTGLLVSLSASAGNQFCVVDNFGNKRQCYFSLSTCQSTLKYIPGLACALVQDQQLSSTKAADDYYQAQARERERLRQENERQAHMNLIYAQQRQIEQQSAYQVPACPVAAPAPSVTYRCTTKEGDSVYSSTPYVGCVVIAVN